MDLNSIVTNAKNSKKGLNVSDLNERCEQLEELILKHEHFVMMGKLCAGIAHELKNPLGLVDNFSEVSIGLVEDIEEGMRDLRKSSDKDSDSQIEHAEQAARMLRDNLKRIQENTQRAAKIIKSVLGSVRLENRMLQPIDINSTTDLHVKLAYQGVRARNKNFNVSIQKDLDSNLSPIIACEEEIGRAILNIADNAFDMLNELFIKDPDFKPMIHLTTKLENEMLKISIKDNGVGIKEEDLEKIFQPFYSTKKNGSGIGLALTWAIIVNNHKGKIQVESQVGQGTTFHLYLPFLKNSSKDGK